MPSFFLISAKTYSERISTEIDGIVHKVEPLSIHTGEGMLRAILSHFPTPLCPSYNLVKMATSASRLTAWSAAPKVYSQLRWGHQWVEPAHGWAHEELSWTHSPGHGCSQLGVCDPSHSCRDCATIPLPSHFLGFAISFGRASFQLQVLGYEWSGWGGWAEHLPMHRTWAAALEISCVGPSWGHLQTCFSHVLAAMRRRNTQPHSKLGWSHLRLRHPCSVVTNTQRKDL